LRKLGVVAVLCGLFLMAGSAYGQQFDAAFGLGGLSAPSSSSANLAGTPVSEGGGVYPSFSGDFLFKKHFGVGAEISWRATQAKYAGVAPYRPVFYDVDAVYVRGVSRASLELLGGIGAESLRFYQPYFSCGFTGCTNYTSSNHFMGVLGAGVRLYVWGHMFVRPEMRAYLIHNNVEFNSNHAIRYGASIGYTFASFNP
jgi:Outer membrane protein beta-barrel domain